MASDLHAITTPVVGTYRHQSSGTSKPEMGHDSSSVRERDTAAQPSLGDERVEAVNVHERRLKADVERTLDETNGLAKYLSRKLTFSYDDRIEKVIVKVTEGDSEKVIRQIPPEEMIRLSLKMDAWLGTLINQSV